MQFEFYTKFAQEEEEDRNFENDLAQLMKILLGNLISTVKSRNARAILVTQNRLKVVIQLNYANKKV